MAEPPSAQVSSTPGRTIVPERPAAYRRPSGRTAMCGLSAMSLPLILIDDEQAERLLRQTAMNTEDADALAAET